MIGPLVSTGWLRERLGEPGLVVVDCRYRLGEPGAGERLWREGHIPGAAFLDVDRDLAGPPGDRGRHPLPDPASFEAASRRAGIGPDTTVIAYDEAAEGGAARLWWLLRHFGHTHVAVLDGGLRAWRDEGGPMTDAEREPSTAGTEQEPTAAGAEREPSTAGAEHEPTAAGAEHEPTAAGAEHEPSAGGFTAEPRRDDTAELAEEALAGEAGERAARRPETGHGRVLVDARAPERYRGEVEPIDAVAGHIPGAVNLPFTDLAPGGRFLPPDELRARFEAVGARSGDEVVAYCGSGVTACVLVLAAEVAGLREARLYPGSWSEWSRRGLAG